MIVFNIRVFPRAISNFQFKYIKCGDKNNVCQIEAPKMLKSNGWNVKYREKTLSIPGAKTYSNARDIVEKGKIGLEFSIERATA